MHEVSESSNVVGLETVALTKRQEDAEMDVTELKMLRFSLGGDKIRNEYTKGIAQVGRAGKNKLEARLHGVVWTCR